MPKKSISQFTRRRFKAHLLLACMAGHIITIAMEFERVLTSQSSDELLVAIGLLPAKLVIEMHDGNDAAQLST